MDIKTEIFGLEKTFWQTMVDKDVDTASAMMAAKSIVTGAQGAATIDRAAFSKMMSEGKWILHDFSFSDVQVVSPAPDVAVIGYKVLEHVTVDGEKLELTAADSSTWCKDGGRWLCVLHTESVLGDPFGRDKAPRKKS